MNYMLEHRSRKATVEEIEQESLAEMIAYNVKTGTKRIPELPFGFMNDRWEHFKTLIQEGDELFYADHQWGPLHGWGGWLLVRKDVEGSDTVAAKLTVRVS